MKKNTSLFMALVLVLSLALGPLGTAAYAEETVTDEPLPPAAGEPLPPATGEPLPPATDEPLPPATGEPLPPATGEPLPPATDEPLPPATDEPLPPANDNSLQPDAMQLLSADEPQMPTVSGTHLFNNISNSYFRIDSVDSAIAAANEAGEGTYACDENGYLIVYVISTSSTLSSDWDGGLPVHIIGLDAYAAVSLGSDTVMAGPLTLDGVKLSAPKNSTIYANGFALIAGNNVTTVNPLTVYGGGKGTPVTADTSVSLFGGTYQNVYGGGKNASVTGNTSVIVSDSAVVKVNLYGGGDDTVSGETNVELGFGATAGWVCGGGSTGDVAGDTHVSVSGKATLVFGGGGRDTTVWSSTNVVIEESGTVTSGVYGGSSGTGSVVDRDTFVTVRGKITGAIAGGSTWNSIVNGSATVDVYGQYPSSFITGGPLQGGVVNGDTLVTLHPGSSVLGVIGGAQASDITYRPQTGADNGIVLDNATATVIYGGSYGGIATGNLSVTLKNGSNAKTIVAGSYSYAKNISVPTSGTQTFLADGNELSAAVTISNSTVGTLFADGVSQLPIQGEINVLVEGASSINYICGNADKTMTVSHAQPQVKGADAINVAFTDADATVYQMIYDIDAVTLTNATLTMPLDGSVGEFEQLIDVQDLSVGDQSHLILNRSNAILGTYTGGGTDAARLTLPAGKMLIAAGTVEGKTALTIAETEGNSAALAQVYLVAQTAGSKGSVTWTDSQSPARFALKQSADVFGGTPANANLTAEALLEQTGSGTADQKWWLVREDQSPAPSPTPDPGPDRDPKPDPGPKPTTPVNPPETEIVDPETPLAPAPVEEPGVTTPPALPPDEGFVVIEPGEIPLGNLPQTGSTWDSRAALSLAALALAGFAAAASAVLLSGKKKKN